MRMLDVTARKPVLGPEVPVDAEGAERVSLEAPMAALSLADLKIVPEHLAVVAVVHGAVRRAVVRAPTAEADAREVAASAQGLAEHVFAEQDRVRPPGLALRPHLLLEGEFFPPPPPARDEGSGEGDRERNCKILFNFSRERRRGSSRGPTSRSCCVVLCGAPCCLISGSSLISCTVFCSDGFCVTLLSDKVPAFRALFAVGFLSSSSDTFRFSNLL